MFQQNQILRTREALQQVRSDRSLESRIAIAHQVCERFGKNAGGHVRQGAFRA